MENKNYTISTASITADRGQTLQADIMELGGKTAENMMITFKDLQSEYWKLHKILETHRFDSQWDSTETLEKLGQFQIAIKAVGDAYQALVTVKCFS